MVNKALFSSKSHEYETPQELFDLLNSEFHFTLDPCADPDNRKCECYFDKSQNGLTKDWAKYSSSVFCNPPYDKRTIESWFKKCYEEAVFNGIVVVMLVPSRTDTTYWHKYVKNAYEIRHIKGRLQFTNRKFPSYKKDGSFKKSPAPFPSSIIIFKRFRRDYPIVKFWDWKKEFER